MTESEVKIRLDKWAKWRLKSGVPLGFPSRSSFMRDAPSDGMKLLPGVDVECEITNKAYEEHLGTVYQIILHIEYLSPIRTEVLRARCYGKSRRIYRQDNKRAHMLLGNAIELVCKQIEQATLKESLTI